MKLIIKYFKKYYINIIITILLVSGQVAVTLSIPKYMANMINIGIQQKGIQTYMYPFLSKERYNMLNLSSTTKEKQLLADSYELKDDKYVLVKKSTELENFTITRNNFFITVMLEEDNGDTFAKSIKIANIYKIADLNDVEKAKYFEQYKLTKMAVKDKIIQSNIIYQEIKNVNESDPSIKYITSKGMEMLLVAISGMIFVILAAYTASILTTSVARDVRKRVFEKVESLSSSELESFSTASLITRTITDTNTLQQFSGMTLRIGVLAPLTAIGAIIQTSTISLDLIWIVVVVIILFIFLIGYAVIVLIPQFSKMQKNIDRLNLAVRENLSGLRVIRAFNTQKVQTKRFVNVIDDIRGQSLIIRSVFALVGPGTSLIMNLGAVMIVFFGAQLINTGTMEIGSLLSFIQFAMQIMMSFLLASMMFFFVPRLIISLERIDEVLESKSIISEPNTSKMGNGNGEVIFDHVRFAYAKDSEPALYDLSFKAEKGKIIAFIGGTGSGKTTIGKLLQRFYDPTSGAIFVNGENIRDYSKNELNKKIGYVPQKSQVFSMSIAENIAYGSKFDIERVKWSAKIACADEFINEKEDGYDYVLEQRGANLSGGQKQRIQIARAIYKNPDILFFDDSFSALDYKTDVKLRTNLQKEMKNTTILIVAQRIPTIMHADEIIVLDNGEVVGRGTHETLLASCHVYQEIASSQLKEGNGNE